MRIGIINIEPKIFNTAYMQIAGYHKGRGDEVGWWSPLEDKQFDVVYCSSIFDFTDKSEVPARAICGGTGFDVTSRLSVAMENCELDYSIYPQCKASYIWFSRGCIRDCTWCVVRQKEGILMPAKPKNLNPNGTHIKVMDNNFFANEFWSIAFGWLQRANQPVDFQGIDIRTLTDNACDALDELRHYRQIKIAWDDPKISMESSLKWLITRINPHKLMCYVLIGYNSTEEQDLYRVEKLRELGIDPFAMPYNRRDLYQRSFARWVNHKAIFKKVKWEDYRQRISRQEEAGTGWRN